MAKEVRFEEREMKITRDKKQTKVAIPAEFVDEIGIDPTTDSIIWGLFEDEEGHTLIGKLKRR